jgi:hypothetical protein
MILVVVAPTVTLTSPSRAAPSGTWLVRVTNNGSALVENVDAWIQRDDFTQELPGRQSRFGDRNYVRLDTAGREIETDEGHPESYVKRTGTISGIATGKLTHVVGGYRRRDGKEVRYSGRGLGASSEAGGSHRIPKYLAVSDDSIACPGVLAAGARSGSVIAMSGTSVAAPQATRLIAARKEGVADGGVSGDASQTMRIPPSPATRR